VKPRLKYLVGVVGVAALTVALTACGGSTPQDASATGATGGGGSSSGTSGAASATSLVAGWTGDINSMDPLQASVIQNRILSVNVYEPLIQYKTTTAADGTQVWDGLSLAPALATSWTTKGAAVTFKIRPNVKFYGSNDVLTANDVYYTYARALEDTKGYGAFNLNLAGLFTPSQIKVVDASTITFNFTAVKGGPPTLLPVALGTLRYPQVGILDSKVMKAHTTTADPWADSYLTNHAVGTGPYYVASHTSGEQVVLKAVPGYWGKAPKYTTVTLRDVGDADMTALLKGGSVQYADGGISNQGYQSLKNSGMNVVTEQVPNQMRAQLDMTDPDLKDARVRQAIAYAMPYDAILKTAFDGRNERAFSWDNPKAPDFDPAWNIYSTNLGKAKSLMSAAGNKGFTLDLYYDSGVYYNQDVALLIQSGLAQIGIKIALHAQPTAQYAADSNLKSTGKTSTQHGMSFYTDGWWLDNAGPSTDTWIKTGAIGNWSQYSNKQVDAIHAQYYTSSSPNRDAEYKKLQQLVAADVPIIPLVVVGRTVVMAKGITGDFVAPDGLARYWSLSSTS
jgi:peptide/nickel transport system substrate-binding protein